MIVIETGGHEADGKHGKVNVAAAVGIPGRRFHYYGQYSKLVQAK